MKHYTVGMTLAILSLLLNGGSFLFCSSASVEGGRRTQKKIVPSSQLMIEEMKAEAEQLFIKGFDSQEKERVVKELVDRAVTYLESHEIREACNAFSSAPEFVSGEVYLFVFTPQGQMLAHGEQHELIFSQMYDARDQFGIRYVAHMIDVAHSTGEWVTYSWRNAMKRAYIRKVTKGSESFIVGAGYYPHTKADAVINMVKAGVTLFNETVVQQGYDVSEPFSTMNYPIKSVFMYGDLYLFALGFDGTVRAQADRPGLTGLNSLEYKDGSGIYPNKEIIEKLSSKKSGEGVWVEYDSKNARKKVYAEKVTDKKGQHYFIACGYYPEVGQKSVVDLVARAFQYMEGHGKSAAIDAFSSKRDTLYRIGDLSLVVYDMAGVVIAHGMNDELIGKNMFNEKDEDGIFYVQHILKQAEIGNGWVAHKLRNTYQSVYVEKVKLGVEEYVITSGIYVGSKSETMAILVKSGITALESAKTAQDAFSLFIDAKGTYIRGDLKLFVFDTQGICYAWGDTHDLIWKNIIDWRDQVGHPFIRTMIEAVKSGPSKTVFQFNGRKAIAYFDEVKKDGVSYIIGSSFYL